MALPDESKNKPSPPPTINRLTDRQLLDIFKQNPLGIARNLIKQPDQLNRFWQLLEQHSPGDRALMNAYDKAQNVLGKIPPAPQPQPAAAPIPGAPPTVTAEQLIQPEARGAKRNEIGPQNAKQLEKFLNDFKPKFDAYMAEKRIDAASSAHVFTQGLMGLLAMYRGGVAQYYLTEGAMEMMFSALGPIGNLWRAGYLKNYDLKMAWMKNPLNPDAVYYYLNSLPTREAFKILYLPVKATWAILTHGGAPFTTRATYIERKYDPGTGPWDEAKTGNFFTPVLKINQATDILADGLARGIQFSPSHDDFTQALSDFKDARLSGDKSKIRAARRTIRHLLDRNNSFAGIGDLPKAIIRTGLINTYRRLKRHDRDPISYVLSLVAGSIFDMIMTLTVRPLAVIANKLINFIPGVNVLRTQLAEFLSSSRYLTTAKIGGASISSFVRGVFSPTTFSFGYVGYNLIPGSPLAQALLTPTFAGIGAFYKTAVNLANMGIYDVYGELNPVGWVRRYDALVAKGDFAALEKGYLKGFKPGPITRFADFLHTNWALRLPINGWVAADFLSPLMQRLYGWSPTVTHAVFTAADYLWQIKGPVLKTIGNFITRLPFVQNLVTQIQFGVTFPLRNWWFNMVNKATAFQQGLAGAVPVEWQTRTWAKFGQNFFNPGFFMGLGLIPFFSGFMPTPLAYVIAPVAGSLVWNGAAFALEKTFGMRIASMAKINAWGWTGYIVGSVMQLIFPALPSWFGLATALAFPAMGMLFSALNISLTNLLAAAIAPIYTAVTGLTLSAGVFAGWLAGWATVMSIASVAGLTIFAAYAVYAGFWVPMIEQATAGPESSNFSITTDVSQIGPNQFEICSSFNITEELFNTAKYLNHEFDFRGTQLNVDLSDPTQTTSAFRRLPGSAETALVYTPFDPNLNRRQYSVALPAAPPDIVGGNQIEQALVTLLSVPYDTPGTLLDLVKQFPSLSQAIRPYLEAIQQQAKDELNQTDYLLTEAEAQRDLARGQKAFLDRLSPKYGPSANINIIAANLGTVAGLATNNPLDDPSTITCDPSDSRCPVHKSTLTSLYNSWDSFINQHLTRVELLLSQARTISGLPADDPLRQTQFDNLLNQLKTAQTSVDEQRDNLEIQLDVMNDLINQIRDISLSDEDARFIADLNLFQLNQLADADWDRLSQILKDNFGNVFGGSKYYYVPKGSNYKVCVDADYQGPPGESQTVCSSINAQQSPWVYGTAFATHCTTFTPQ